MLVGKYYYYVTEWYCKGQTSQLQQKFSNVCKIVSRKISALSRASSFCTNQQKKVEPNSSIIEEFNFCSLILMFSPIRSYRKVEKLHGRSLQLCQID